MAYVPTGFTPDEEKALLAEQLRQGKSIDEIAAAAKREETVRTITTVSIIAGLLFTLLRTGDLIAQVRGRRRPSSEES